MLYNYPNIRTLKIIKIELTLEILKISSEF